MKKLFLLPLYIALCGFAFSPPQLTELYFTSGGTVTAPNSTGEETLGGVPLPTLLPDTCVRVEALFQYTNNANNKTTRVKLSTSNLSALTQTTSLNTLHVVTFCNQGATNSQFSYPYTIAGTSTLAATTTTTSIDTSVPVALSFTCQKAAGGDTCTLAAWHVTIIP